MGVSDTPARRPGCTLQLQLYLFDVMNPLSAQARCVQNLFSLLPLGNDIPLGFSTAWLAQASRAVSSYLLAVVRRSLSSPWTSGWSIGISPTRALWERTSGHGAGAATIGSARLPSRYRAAAVASSSGTRPESALWLRSTVAPGRTELPREGVLAKLQVPDPAEHEHLPGDLAGELVPAEVEERQPRQQPQRGADGARQPVPRQQEVHQRAWQRRDPPRQAVTLEVEVE